MLRSLLILTLASLGMGVLSAPLCKYILAEEIKSELLPPQLNKEDFTQQLAVVTLGGLRSLSAAILSIDAFESFLTGDWATLEHRYNQIFTLVPHRIYYWDSASWHLAYNAAAAQTDNTKLSPQEQRFKFLQYIEKGKNVLRRGIEKNPKSWILYSRLGALEADRYRRPNYEAAAAAFKEATRLGAPPITSRQEFYALAQIPARSKEAWELGRKLFEENKDNRVPSLICSLYALENRLNIPDNERIPFDKLFRNKEDAARLFRLQLQSDRSLPSEGLQEFLDQLKRNKQ